MSTNPPKFQEIRDQIEAKVTEVRDLIKAKREELGLPKLLQAQPFAIGTVIKRPWATGTRAQGILKRGQGILPLFRRQTKQQSNKMHGGIVDTPPTSSSPSGLAVEREKGAFPGVEHMHLSVEL